MIDSADVRVSATIAPVGAGASPVEPTVVRARRSRPSRLVSGVAFLVIGTALVLGGCSMFATAPMLVRVLLVLVGVGCWYAGYRDVGRGLLGEGWRAAYWLAVAWLGSIVALAIAAPLLPLGESSRTDLTLNTVTLARPDIPSTHPLGTNGLGLDLLARAIYGARVSLVIALGAVAIGLVIGGLIGLVAGFIRGPFDVLVRVLSNSILSFPPLIFLLALSTVIPRTTFNLALALGVLITPINIRLARANTIATMQREFVLTAESLGASRRRLMFSELLPNVMMPSIAYALVLVPLMIVTEAALSFLGLGVQAPKPSWGNMIAEGQNGVFEANPHIVLVPGAFLVMSVLALNVVANQARKRAGYAS